MDIFYIYQMPWLEKLDHHTTRASYRGENRNNLVFISLHMLMIFF
jgi:hypothetical protein